MSLQLAAKHLSNQGRGPDDTLVHMSRGEVKSLNDLAMAHGGHLTINPETGLPEAGFLSMLLPMVAGAVLGPAGPVGLTALQAGLAVGAGSYLLNPKAGLMGSLSAGLGGYGGAGLAEGLSNIGATSEAGLTSTGASMDYAAQNAEAIKNAQAFEQAKLAQAAQANTQALESAKYLTDYGAPVNEFAQTSARLPTSPGGIEVAASTPASTPVQPLASRPPIGADFEQQAELMNRDNLLRNPLTENQLGQSATGFDTMKRGAQSLINDPTADKFKTLGGGNYMGLAQKGLAAAAPAITAPAKLNAPTSTSSGKQVVPHYRFSPGMVSPTPAAGATGTENTYFNPSYTALSDADAASLYPGYPSAQAADGGLMGYATGGIPRYGFGGFIGDAVNDIGSQLGSMFKGGNSDFGNVGPMLEGAKAPAGTRYDPETKQYVPINSEQMATGGISDARYNLGSYSDGGRLLRGPGDGVSDSIPAMIGKKQPARLADGEFVVPARIVSEIGNGSTEAGARKLYAMMDRIQAARGKTVGKGKVAKNTRADKYLPA